MMMNNFHIGVRTDEGLCDCEVQYSKDAEGNELDCMFEPPLADPYNDCEEEDWDSNGELEGWTYHIKMPANLDSLSQAYVLHMLHLKLADKIHEAAMEETEELNKCLSVTACQVYPLSPHAALGNIKAIANVTLNDQLVLRSLRVMTRSNIVEARDELYVGYPNDPFFKGEDMRSIYFPITKTLRDHIETCVLEKYKAVMEL